jgi:hypothetical protein
MRRPELQHPASDHASFIGEIRDPVPGEETHRLRLRDLLVSSAEPTDSFCLAGLSERDVLVDGQIVRQAQDSLGDEVALDLVTAPADRVNERPHGFLVRVLSCF